MFLLDTSICIYLMKNSFPAMTERFLAQDASSVAVSAITVFELEYGAEKSHWGTKNRQNIWQFLSPMKILPFSGDDAIVAGRIRAYLMRMGTPIGAYDLQIAAQGLARGFTVVTHNTSEFSRIPNLMLADWVLETMN